ncbi:MAG: molybdopterin-dependent oxidoreductase [Acidimicrobiia bacterium]|nr:molybdopterin-dependent oxidoreductase [Acidimicrobiia bacterium]
MTTSPITRKRVRGGVGDSPLRIDGIPKVTGNFAYASDLYADGMLWAATLRSPHARARITKLDTAPAYAVGGVVLVLTQEDVVGRPGFGMHVPDQPVFADGECNYWGEPIAVVVASDLPTAKLGVEAIDVEFEELEPLTDMEEADARDSQTRRMKIRRGDRDVEGAVVVEGYYEVGQQDQAPLGNEAGLAIPDGDGGVDLYAVSQWVHSDHWQIYPCLDIEPEQVRCHPVGMGGAFGAREDVSMHIHLCMAALRTGRPIKMMYDRAESFVGHVHRHPARMWYRHEADNQGRLVKVEARLILDGGAYESSSNAVIANAAYFAVGPYRCDNVFVDAVAAKTNNPPAGAMRGFGGVQTAFAHEAQMDKLAGELGLDPLEIRLRNALGRGDALNTSGQLIEGSLPTAELINELDAMPLAEPLDSDDARHLPGGTGLTTDPRHVRRGVGYGVTLKNLAFSEAFDDYSDVRIVLSPIGVEVYTAAAEVGQGMVTIIQQLAREVLQIEQVAVVWADTGVIGSAGSTSASRQTQMTGGATHQCAIELREQILAEFGGDDLSGEGVWKDGELIVTLHEVCESGPREHEIRYRHPETFATDENGQGDAHPAWAVAAHRAVVDVDPELGLVRVVQIDAVHDVGRLLNPVAALGQIEGGTLQGVGLATLEELVLDRGVIKNANFTDYLLPTFLDAPHVEVKWVEEPERWGPLGAKGIGEPPTISAGPAVAAAIRNAIGADLIRVPILPQHIVGA